MDIRKYIFSHCTSPIPVKQFDPVKGRFVTRLVPCGKCLHCKNQKKNEWSARLYAHALYCKNVYYITLDYAPFDEFNSSAMALAADTAACHHALNSTHHYALHPILLRREHLQKFFKRLRKNHPDKSFQYFACGEYGSSYVSSELKSTGYGRPHFHCIIFSNDTWSTTDFQSAWTVNGYKIGNIDFHDLRANGTFLKNNDSKFNAKFVFSYVCKYLQKDDFDFEKLATIEFHKAYFQSLQKTLVNVDTLFPELVDITDKKVIEFNWKKYCEDFAPFVCCSKRPAIGLQYLQDNLQRFQAQDFRLFGIQEKNLAFPKYFIRKTKESLCCIQAIGDISCKPSSSSRVGDITSLLREIRDINLSIDNWSESPSAFWRSLEENQYNLNIPDSANKPNYIKNQSISFYDMSSKLFYNFNGYDYDIFSKVRKVGFVRVGSLSLDNAISFLEKKWLPYFDGYLIPMDKKREQTESKLFHDICNYFNSTNDPEVIIDKFRDMVASEYKLVLNEWNQKKCIINQSKQVF